MGTVGNPNPSPATRFTSGNQIGLNARGVPKKRRITTRIIAELERDPDNTGMTMEQRIARKVVEMAAEGDSEMVRFIADRVEGRVMQAVEVMAQISGPTITADTPATDVVRIYAQMVSTEGGVDFDDETSEEDQDAEMMTIEGEFSPVDQDKETA